MDTNKIKLTVELYPDEYKNLQTFAKKHNLSEEKMMLAFMRATMAILSGIEESEIVEENC